MADQARGPIMDLLTELDRLEELLEDMAELGVRSVAEIEERIALLDARVEDIEKPGIETPMEPPRA